MAANSRRERVSRSDPEDSVQRDAGNREFHAGFPDWLELGDALEPDELDPLPEPGDFWIDEEVL